jgi:hypothetical protein
VVGTAARSAAGPNPRLGIVQAPQPPRAQFAPSRLADLVHRAVMQSERPAVPRRPDHPLAGHDLALAA